MAFLGRAHRAQNWNTVNGSQGFGARLYPSIFSAKSDNRGDFFSNFEGTGYRDFPVSVIAVEESFLFKWYAFVDRQLIRVEFCFGWPQVISLETLMRDRSSEIKNLISRY